MRRSTSACATRRAEISPAASSSPIAAATVAGTRPGSDSGENSASQTPSAISRQQLARRRQCEPCLADAAWAGQGHEPMGGGQADDLAQFVVAANQFGDRPRQIGWRHVRCRAQPRRRVRTGMLISSRHGRAP